MPPRTAASGSWNSPARTSSAPIPWLFDRLRKDFEDQSRAWQHELCGDSTIGGDRLHASLTKAKGLIEEVLSPEDAKALIKHADGNGMGNHPALIRMLVNMADRLDVVKKTETARAEAQRAAAARNAAETAGPPPGRAGRGWYGNMGDGG